MKGYVPHWPNPWLDVVYVPIEELAEVAHGLGQQWSDVDGSSFIMTKERMLEYWHQNGDKLDAYILPQPSGWHCIGIRYGAEDSQYLSPGCNRAKTEALLCKYR